MEVKEFTPKFGRNYTKFLSDQELTQELEFACAHLDVLFKEYKKRAMSGSKRVGVRFEEEVGEVAKAAAAIR